MVKVEEITEKLVRIPSYREIKEKQVAEFIEEFVKRYCPPYLSISRQKVSGKERYNLIINDGFSPRVVFFCHMDTVDPKARQISEGNLIVFKDKDKLCGLGSVDMKGGIGALLSALTNLPSRERTKGLALVFYCDEENDFKGMGKIINSYNLTPEIAIFCEPTDLEIANGCRGLIEIKGDVRGKTAHASRPSDGLNAICLAVEAFKTLQRKVGQYSHKILGNSVCNLASLNGGLNKGLGKNNVLRIGRAGNNVPDVAKVILECRTTSFDLDANMFLGLYKTFVSHQGGEFELEGVKHNYGSFSTLPEKLEKIEAAVRSIVGEIVYSDLSSRGYYDAQMLAERFSVPCVMIGPGPCHMSHKEDEYVSIETLEKASAIYAELLKNYQVI